MRGGRKERVGQIVHRQNSIKGSFLLIIFICSSMVYWYGCPVIVRTLQLFWSISFLSIVRFGVVEESKWGCKNKIWSEKRCILRMKTRQSLLWDLQFQASDVYGVCKIKHHVIIHMPIREYMHMAWQYVDDMYLNSEAMYCTCCFFNASFIISERSAFEHFF